MHKRDLVNFANDVKLTIIKHSPGILTGIGIAGMVTSTVLAVSATPKALRLLEEKRESEGELKPIDVVKTCWKPYIPATVTGVLSIGCLIGANSVNARRNAALATAYKLSETAFTEYRDKVTQTIGEKKEKTIQEQVDKDHIDKNPVTKSEVFITNTGDTLCYDSISGRYFTSSIDKIKRTENVLNEQMINGFCGYTSLNDLYDELGLTHTSIGDEIGWNLQDGLIKINFSTHLADDDRPCVVMNFNVAPRYGYSHYL